MSKSNLPQKRKQKILQPVSSDLESTTVHTVQTTPNNTYPTAADDFSDIEATTTDVNGSAPSSRESSPNMRKSGKRLHVIITLISVLLLIFSATDIVRLVVADITLSVRIIEDLLLIALALAFYKRKEFARFALRLLTALYLVASSLGLAFGVYGLVTDKGIYFPLYVMLASVATTLVLIALFIFLGRQDLRRLFS